MTTFELILLGLIVIQTVVVMTLLWMVRDMRRRHDVLGQQTALMLARHQDSLATHAAALNMLGGRVAMVPTSQELASGRFQL
jgi:hypothetical protein